MAKKKATKKKATKAKSTKKRSGRSSRSCTTKILVSREFCKDSIEWTDDGRHIVINDRRLLAGILALHKDCCLTFTVIATCPPERPRRGDTFQALADDDGGGSSPLLGCK